MKGPGGFLLVRSGGQRIGLPLAQIREVIQLGDIRPVPVVARAVRGVIAVHGRMMPLINLSALLNGDQPSLTPGSMGVVASVDGRRVCLEVDDAEILVRDSALPVPPGETLPWAIGVARYADGLVPLLDLAALSTRLMEDAST
jgi:purine-binding chemotaxis protein CheW